MSRSKLKALKVLSDAIVGCRRCPRLVRHREKVAREKRRAFRDCTYWGRPVPGFGDAQARLVIVGLAPAAHGANRTGRMFTGDRSGDFLYRMLHHAGFASQPASRHRGDGLALHNAYITAAARCAPPGNKPLPGELANCRKYLETELELLKPGAVLALGKIAFDTYLKPLADRGHIQRRSDCPFRHGASYALPGNLPRLFAAYHPSQQNTQTGRVTAAMYRRVLREIVRHLGSCAETGKQRGGGSKR